MKSWDELTYWDSGEWQVVDERLRDLDKVGMPWCPGRKNLFKAMELTPLEEVRVMIIGQDPYPDPKHAMGLSFSVPKTVTKLPPSLENILSEFNRDLPHLPKASHGDLTNWAKNGVFLWNAIPSCLAYKSMSHDWPEWKNLHDEVIKELSPRGILFVALGKKAASLLKDVDTEISRVLTFTHPSPRASLNIRSGLPFAGCRMFSEINRVLSDLGLDPIDWKL